MATQSPHDALFKAAFSIKEVAQEFIETFLPEATVKHLNISTLTIAKTDFSDKQMDDYFSDLIYECETTFGEKVRIAIVFEHKSFKPPYPHVQPLLYMTQNWHSKIKQREKPLLTIPIYLYHGKQKWEQKPFFDYFNLPSNELKDYVPTFKYELINLENVPNSVLYSLQVGYLITALALLKHAREKAYIQEHIVQIFEPIDLEDDEKNSIHFAQTALYYLAKITIFKDKSEYMETVQQLSKEWKPEYMTAWQLAEKEGFEKGRILERKNLIKSLLTEMPDASIEQISKFTKAKPEFIKLVMQEMKQNKSKK